MKKLLTTPNLRLSSLELPTIKMAYIGGKISGLTYVEANGKFYNKQKELEAIGYKVINPFDLIETVNVIRINRNLLPLADSTDRKEIMRICITYLLQCDELHLLPDWKDSAGAWEERTMAQKYGIDIVYP